MNSNTRPLALDNPHTHLRVAVVHDWLVIYGGAERVLEHILDMYPQADLFSLIDKVPEPQRHFLRGKRARTSFLQKLPGIERHYRKLLPLMPLAIEQFDFSGYDLIISSSYCVAKGALSGPNQVHVSYCHSPMRYAWDHYHEYLEQLGLDTGLKSWLIRGLLHRIRDWDVRSSNTVDRFVANSQFVQARIRKFYGRESSLVYPPIDTSLFTQCDNKQNFYMAAGRFVPFKRLDLVVDAFRNMPERKLVMLGDGPEMDKLRSKAGPNVEFLGFQPPEVMRDYLSRAKAFIFPSEEDFGIVPVEAQACGTPVIAFASGGALETVIPVSKDTAPSQATGMWFAEQTPTSLQAAIQAFDELEDSFDPAFISVHASSFAPQQFKQQLLQEVEEALGQRAYQPSKPEGAAIPAVVLSNTVVEPSEAKPHYRAGVPLHLHTSSLMLSRALHGERQKIVVGINADALRKAETSRDLQYQLNRCGTVIPFDKTTCNLVDETAHGMPLDTSLAVLLENHRAVLVTDQQETSHNTPGCEISDVLSTRQFNQKTVNQFSELYERCGAELLVIRTDVTKALDWLQDHASALPCKLIVVLPCAKTREPLTMRLKFMSQNWSTVRQPDQWWRRQKLRVAANRALDICGAGTAIMAASPLLLLTCLAIRLESKGPVLFKQQRVGLRGRPFTMFKFRSMYVDAEARLADIAHLNESQGGVLFKVRNDPRITRVGRFIRKYSIDELPQFFNVLLGHMSLVGPRPALPREVEQYTHEQRKRLQTKPGITCIWQVSGRSNLNFEQQVQLDIDYLAQQDITQDVAILARTLPAVLKGEGAY